VTSPFLEPVAAVWARVAGIAMLLAGAGLTAVLGYLVFDAVLHEQSRRALTSSSVIFGLILLALCGICWQAGYRLVVQRSGRPGALFSRPAWFAIGAGLIVITALMAAVVSRARGPTLLDLQVVLFLGGIGVWCLVLALRRPL
jgi:vacuolar-type H+-ATPase subunit I/STV1